MRCRGCADHILHIPSFFQSRPPSLVCTCHRSRKQQRMQARHLQPFFNADLSMSARSIQGVRSSSHPPPRLHLRSPGGHTSRITLRTYFFRTARPATSSLLPYSHSTRRILTTPNLSYNPSPLSLVLTFRLARDCEEEKVHLMLPDRCLEEETRSRKTGLQPKRKDGGE